MGGDDSLAPRRRTRPNSDEKRPTKTPAASKPAKKKTRKAKKDEKWSDLRSATSHALIDALDTACGEFHDAAISVGDETARLAIGLPFPCFAMEYMFGTTVFQLGRVMQIVGLQGSGKSGLAMEMARWFIEHKGLATLLDHESKFSSSWANSIVGWDNHRHYGYVPCSSVEDWQKKTNFFVDKIQSIMTGTKAERGPGKVFPYLLILDSILGKLTEGTQARIEKDGAASRGHPVEAMLVTRFLQYLPNKLIDWPFSFVYINHIKPGKDPVTQATVRNIGGGFGPKYQQTFDLQVNRKGKIQTNTMDGLKLELRLYKNSLGETDRRIPVSVVWWHEPVDPDDRKGEWRQQTEWRWDAATAELLTKVMPDSHRARAKEVLNMQVASGGRVYCKELGISRDSPVSADEAGKILHANADVMRDLRNVLGVSTFKAFEPGKDYGQQRARVKREIAAKLKEMHK